MINYVIFDLDGTILDTKHTCMLSAQQAYTTITGETLPLNTFNEHFGTPTSEWGTTFGFDGKEFIKAMHAAYIDFSEHTKLYDGFPHVLNALQRKSISFGVATSKNSWELNFDLELLDLKKYFDCCICADDIKNRKPHPEPIQKILETTNNNKYNTIFIGDTDIDFRCAKAAGVKFALADWGEHNRVDAPIIFSDPNDILDFIENENEYS